LQPIAHPEEGHHPILGEAVEEAVVVEELDVEEEVGATTMTRFIVYFLA
jgi:hypothetical protein